MQLIYCFPAVIFIAKAASYLQSLTKEYKGAKTYSTESQHWLSVRVEAKSLNTHKLDIHFFECINY